METFLLYKYCLFLNVCAIYYYDMFYDMYYS